MLPSDHIFMNSNSLMNFNVQNVTLTQTVIPTSIQMPVQKTNSDFNPFNSNLRLFFNIYYFLTAAFTIKTAQK